VGGSQGGGGLWDRKETGNAKHGRAQMKCATTQSYPSKPVAKSSIILFRLDRL
jgi:hypothetical protein